MRDGVVKTIAGLSDSERDVLQFADAFLAEQYARRVERHFEYKLTATYARMIFSGGGGILYPSVQARGGMNVAFPAARFDELFEVLYTEAVYIEDYYGSGVYNVSRKRFSCDLDKDGTIRWESKKEIPRLFHWIHGMQVGPFEGWTVPKESS